MRLVAKRMHRFEPTASSVASAKARQLQEEGNNIISLSQGLIRYSFKIFMRKIQIQTGCCLIVSLHKRHFSDHLDRLNIVLPTLILFTSIFTIPLSRSHAPHQSTNRSNVSKPQKILHKYIFEKTQNVVVEHDKTVKTKIHKNSF